MGLWLKGASCIGPWRVAALLGLPYMLLLSCEHILHYFDHLRKRFFIVVDKVACELVGGLGGPPRLAAGRLSAAGSKAGSKVGTLHGNSPPIGWQYGGSWPTWELPSL